LAFDNKEHQMKKLLYPIILLAGLALVPVAMLVAQAADAQHPLVLSDAVLPTTSKDPPLDARIFNPEFYRKFNPNLGLSTDAEATKQWTSSGANHCLRASFTFYSTDYLNRYPEPGLSPATVGACDYAIRQFVTYGFNQGRIGAFDSYPIVFDFNYYVDAANNPDMNKLYSDGTWDQVDLQIHWLHRGIEERRVASAFFSIKDYQERYSDVSGLRPERALFHYVTKGQAERRLGKILWADPSEWNALVDTTQNSVVTAAPNDLVRNFTAANGKPTTVIVKSPKWYISPSEPYPSTVHVCDVPPPIGNNDWNTLTTFLTPAGVKVGCDVVRLAPNTSYHLVLPQNQPPSLNYVLNHWPYLQINNAQDFVFDGNGSTLFFTGPTQGIDINNSQRVVIQNLTVDYGNPVDPNALWRGPLFAAIGTIVPDGTSSAHIVLDADTPIPPGFSPYMYAFNLWDRKKHEIAHDDYLNTGPNDQGCDYACIVSHGQQDPSQQSMFVKNGSLYPKSNPSGQWVASQLAQYPNRDVMVRFSEFLASDILDDYGSSDIRIINTTVLTSPYIGISAGQGGRGLSFENVTVKPSQGRPISTMADNHIVGVGGDIVVEGGDFSHEGDDVLNVTVAFDTLTTVKSTSSFVISGPDAAPSSGDTLVFFDRGLGYLGSATIESISPSNLPPWGGQPITISLSAPVTWLSSGIYVTDISHVPSRVYISGVRIHDKLGRGILLGGFHMLVQNSTFRNITATGIDAIFSSYFLESTGASDIAIRNDTFVGTNYVPKLYQTSVDGTSYYPARDAAIAMFGDLSTTYDGAWNEVTGIYPSFQDIEISGNTIQSATGTGIYLTGTTNDRIDNNQFTGCRAVADADPVYSYFGSESRSALVLSFADNVLAMGDVASANPICAARTDSASSRNVVVGQ
jgi:parallel beta-helix repeat protein